MKELMKGCVSDELGNSCTSQTMRFVACFYQPKARRFFGVGFPTIFFGDFFVGDWYLHIGSQLQLSSLAILSFLHCVGSQAILAAG